MNDAAVAAADLILRRRGVPIQGRRAGVIGFGSTGEACEARGLPVAVFDRDPEMLLKASLRGYGVAATKRHLPGNCGILFSATGSRAVDDAGMAYARDGLTLVSAGPSVAASPVPGFDAEPEAAEDGNVLPFPLLPRSEAGFAGTAA